MLKTSPPQDGSALSRLFTGWSERRSFSPFYRLAGAALFPAFLQVGRSGTLSRLFTGWSERHSFPPFYRLAGAAAECRAFPKRNAEIEELVSCAEAVEALRTALLTVQPDMPSSWAVLVSALDAITSPEHKALAEVKNAWLEFHQAREQLVSHLKASLKEGGLRPTGAGKRWDHIAIDTEGLTSATQKLQLFPSGKPENTATSAPLLKRSSSAELRRSVASTAQEEKRPSLP